LASREAAAATGLQVLTPSELAGGAAVDLLANVPDEAGELIDGLVRLDGTPA
jgi:hypothetical protein